MLANADLSPLIVVAIFAFAIFSMVWHFKRGQTLVERWAARNGFRLISTEYRWIRRGPFWWRTSKGQSVYHVEVCDGNGEYRSGYVRVGSWIGGLFTDVADVKWDRPRSTQGPPGFPVIVHEDENQHDDTRR